VLPGFSIIGSYWLVHMAVLSCTVIGRVDLVEPGHAGGYVLDEYQIHKTNTTAITELIKCKSFTDMLFGVANAMVCLFSLTL